MYIKSIVEFLTITLHVEMYLEQLEWIVNSSEVDITMDIEDIHLKL